MYGLKPVPFGCGLKPVAFAGPERGHIAIRSCSGFDELDACVQLQIEPGATTRASISAQSLFSGAEGGRPGHRAFDTDGRRAAGTGGIAGRLRGLVAGREDRQQRGSRKRRFCRRSARANRNLSSFPHAGGAPGAQKRGIGVRLKLEQRREALQRNLRHMEWTFIHWRSRTLFSIFASWERSPAGMRSISMVYPHLDCRVSPDRPSRG